MFNLRINMTLMFEFNNLKEKNLMKYVLPEFIT